MELEATRENQKILWRCLHNAIPCLCVLANRHIGTSAQCPGCKVGAEDIYHFLFKCEREKAVWSALGLHKEIADAALVDRSGAMVIGFLLCDRSFQRTYMDPIELPEPIATTCWYQWWQRRQFVRGEEVQPPHRTSPAIHALALNFVWAAGKPSNIPRVNNWGRGLSEQIVLNIDASVKITLVLVLQLFVTIEVASLVPLQQSWNMLLMWCLLKLLLFARV